MSNKPRVDLNKLLTKIKEEMNKQDIDRVSFPKSVVDYMDRNRMKGDNPLDRETTSQLDFVSSLKEIYNVDDSFCPEWRKCFDQDSGVIVPSVVTESTLSPLQKEWINRLRGRK